MSTTMVWAAVLLFGVAAVYASLQRKLSLPPGPPGLPVLGNAMDMTPHEMWRRAWQWGKGYGDMIYLKMFGFRLLFLNSPEAVNELLHKRGAIYSDRAHFVMACELAGFGNIVPLTKYGDKFKLERKLMNQALGFSALEKWQPAVARETHLLLSNLLEEPQYAGSLILTTVYGYHTTLKNDPYIADAEEFMVASARAMGEAWSVDFFPLLRHIPWLGFQKTAATWKSKLAVWVDKPFDMFKSLPDSDLKQNSFCGNLLLDDHGNVSVDAETEDRVKWLATSLYGRKYCRITVVSNTILILALVHNPHVLKKAQKQIDSVVGTDRLPTWADRPQLPYVDCIIKEVLRWGVPVPLSGCLQQLSRKHRSLTAVTPLAAPPHRLIQPDKYREYQLEEGTMCVGNMWACLHDEKLYPDPEKFFPERFELEKDPERLRLMDTDNYAFGFGRRRCPGMHFADQSLFLTFSSIMACFDIAPITDSSGEPILPDVEFNGGVFRHPKPFKCSITPRRENVESLIQAALSTTLI
ncbi:cytochrome P450 [Dichomitus squalens]|uniref:Cytochrome P450 n=1 Tax=Dichomitus squalens TaxID=114155 RepID=A0A4Q9MTI8_9APHY|nr:cytochrome P450 [Dichomitus squalens]